MGSVVLRLIIGLLGTVLSRGILRFLNSKGYFPDRWVSKMIQQTTKHTVPGIGWILAALGGFLCLILWETLDVTSKLQRIVEPRHYLSFEIRSATIYISNNPLSIFMGLYQTQRGPTLSPLCLIFYVQITNLQDVASKINSYSVAVSTDDGSNWKPLRNINLITTSVYNIGNAAAPAANVSPTMRPPILMPKGTYTLASPAQPA